MHAPLALLCFGACRFYPYPSGFFLARSSEVVVRTPRRLWLVKRHWARAVPEGVPHEKYWVSGSAIISITHNSLDHWELYSWLASVSTTRNTAARLGWSRIGLAALILHTAAAGLGNRSVVISSRYKKSHPLQLQTHCAHFPPLQHTRKNAKTQMCETGHG